MHDLRRFRRLVFAALIALAALIPSARARQWVHPAGLLDVATLKEIKRKSETLDWARRVVDDLDAEVQPWLAQPIERIEKSVTVRLSRQMPQPPTSNGPFSTGC